MGDQCDQYMYSKLFRDQPADDGHQTFPSQNGRKDEPYNGRSHETSSLHLCLLTGCADFSRLTVTRRAYPGVPPSHAPKTRKSTAGAQQPLPRASIVGTKHVVVHLRAGDIYRTFIRLVHKAAVIAHVDDESLPRLSPDQSPYRYILIRPGDELPRKGFCTEMATGMLVRRICTTKPAFYSLQIRPEGYSMERSLCVRATLETRPLNC